MALTLDGTNGIVSSGSITTQSATGVIFSDSSNQGAAASPFSLKNRIINGDMAVWQRGTSVAVTNTAYWADRFSTNFQPYTASRSTDAPAGFQYSADINPGSTVNFTTTVQKIESVNCADLVGQTVTISCYAKSISGASAGLGLELNFANAVDNFSTTTNIAFRTLATTLSTSWTRYSATITNLPANAANGLMVTFSTNSTVAANYRITGVQLERNTTATPFEWIPYSTELALCYRYYWQDPSVGLDTPYADTTYNTVTRQYFMPVSMRVIPTVTQNGSVIVKNNIGAVNVFTIDVGTSNTNQTNTSIFATPTAARTFLYRPVQFSAEL